MACDAKARCLRSTPSSTVRGMCTPLLSTRFCIDTRCTVAGRIGLLHYDLDLWWWRVALLCRPGNCCLSAGECLVRQAVLRTLQRSMVCIKTNRVLEVCLFLGATRCRLKAGILMEQYSCCSSGDLNTLGNRFKRHKNAACLDIAEDMFLDVRRLPMAAHDGGSSAGWLAVSALFCFTSVDA